MKKRSLVKGKIFNLKAAEKEIVKKALRSNKGNQSDTAKSLGVSRATLISKLKKYGLYVPVRNVKGLAKDES